MTFIAAENPFVLFALSQKDTSLDDPATLIMEVADWNESGKEESKQEAFRSILAWFTLWVFS